jgi:hypothetical protein
LIVHCFLFWGKDILDAFRSARKGRYDDRHHEYMARKYKEVPQWWYALVLVLSFVLGLVVVLKENITLTPWAYVVALILGSIIAPFVSISHCRSARPCTKSLLTRHRAPSSTLDLETALLRTTFPK